MEISCVNCNKKTFDRDDPTWEKILHLTTQNEESSYETNDWLKDHYVCDECIESCQNGDSLRHEIIWLYMTETAFIKMHAYQYGVENLA